MMTAAQEAKYGVKMLELAAACRKSDREAVSRAWSASNCWDGKEARREAAAESKARRFSIMAALSGRALRITDIRAEFKGVTPRTVSNDRNKLLRLGFLRKEGTPMKRYYSLTEEGEAALAEHIRGEAGDA